MVLTELRKIYKVSMQELADSISVSKQLIGQIEKGKRDITEEVLSKLVDYFGLEDITDNCKSFLVKDFMDDIDIIKVKRAKIKKEINENPVIIGYDPQLTFFGQRPVYQGEDEIRGLDSELKHILFNRIEESFMTLAKYSGKENVIFKYIDMLDDDDCKRDIVMRLLKYFDNEESLEELKKVVNKIEIE